MSTPSPGERRPQLEPGATIADRYVVRAHLGSGGMGDVFEVEHTLLGKRFALKRLSGEGASDRGLVERFLREARAAAATGHPGVVDVVDLGFDRDNQPFLVMEKLVGQTVRKKLERGPMEEPMLRCLGRAVLGALAACHDAGIIHRDIKPENLFLCEDGSVKILDFGLSHTASVDARLTQSGAVMGTPLYMSPEQARGDDVDVRTDLYAVGAVLYECATGTPPFIAPAYSVLVAMILEVKPNADKLLALPEPVREMILAALAKAPKDRPASARAMKEVLGEGPDEMDWGVRERRPVGAAKLLTAETMASSETIAPSEAHSETMAAPTKRKDAEIVSAPTLQAAAPAATASSPTIAPPSIPEQRSVPATRIVPPRASRAWVLPTALAAVLAVILAVVLWPRGGGTPPEPAAPQKPQWQLVLETGDIEAALEESRKEIVRHPDDLELAGRDLLMALLEDRTRAYARVKELEGKKLPVITASAVTAVRAVASGEPDLAVDALGAAEAVVETGTVDDLLVRYARAYLLIRSDHFDQARVELGAILDRWPGFFAALDALIEPLVFRDELAELHRRIDAFIAVAPPGPIVDKLEVESLIADRRYRNALDKIEKMLAADPGRPDEIYQYRGDMRVLLGDPAGAIAAYDPIDDRFKRDEYVAGALAHQGKYDEAAKLLTAAMRDFPADLKPSRLGKLVVDASVLALETGDTELAASSAAALANRDLRKLEAPVQAAAGFARAVVGALARTPLDPDDFDAPGAEPFRALIVARTSPDDRALATLRDVTRPDAFHSGVVTTHVYPPLWLERARGEAAGGDYEAALASLDHVLHPRHYDTSRGAVALPALELEATLLDHLHRSGEAEAVRREISQLRGAQR